MKNLRVLKCTDRWIAIKLHTLLIKTLRYIYLSLGQPEFYLNINVLNTSIERVICPKFYMMNRVCQDIYIQRAIGKLHHIQLIILGMHLICFKFCLLCTKLESVGCCLWGKQNHNAIQFSRNLKLVQLDTHIRTSNTKISKCLGVNLRTGSYFY